MNSIQLMRSISRVETESFWADSVDAEFFKVCAVATSAFAAANRSTIADTDILIFFLRFDLGCRTTRAARRAVESALTCRVVKCRSV